MSSTLTRGRSHTPSAAPSRSTSSPTSTRSRPALAGPADQLEDALEARRALRALAALPERQRRYLTRLASGHSSQEIARVEQASYTNVNKHLRRASDAARPRRSRLTPKGAPPATKRIAPHLKPPAVLGGPDRGHVHVPELVGALDAEEPGALAPPARRPAALQQAVLGHEPSGLLAVHRPPKLPAGQGGDHPGPVGRVPGPRRGSPGLPRRAAASPAGREPAG